MFYLNFKTYLQSVTSYGADVTRITINKQHCLQSAV